MLLLAVIVFTQYKYWINDWDLYLCSYELRFYLVCVVLNLYHNSQIY